MRIYQEWRGEGFTQQWFGQDLARRATCQQTAFFEQRYAIRKLRRQVDLVRHQQHA